MQQNSLSFNANQGMRVPRQKPDGQSHPNGIKAMAAINGLMMAEQRLPQDRGSGGGAPAMNGFIGGPPMVSEADMQAYYQQIIYAQ